SDARERWNTEIDIRPRRKEIGYGGSLLVNLAHRTSFSVGYRTAEYDYESVVTEGGFDVRERLNRREDYANLSFFYQASSRRRFFLDLEYGVYDFESVTQAALRDSRSGAAYAGVEFSPLGRRVRGKLRIGWKAFDVRDPEGTDFAGLVGDSQLTVRLARPFAVRASYLRDVRFSLWYENPYYLESRPGAGASVYVFRFLRFDYDYSRGRSSYPTVQEIEPGLEVKRRDDIEIHSAGVYVRIYKQTALGFVASWWARDSNLDREDDKRTFFGVNLTYEF
ncbi:MAG: outer membrane beta-barrel protein, partial [Acidobacteria bacterium]|nr:outer membrane beta-barrel protein [Acidobacteriota bacterium]